MKDKEVSLPYGSQEELKLKIKENNLLTIARLKKSRPLQLKKEIRNALKNPTGSRPLRVLAKGRKNALLICDDNTRPTPVREILPLLIEELREAGISPQEIKILIANGSHRLMTETELIQKVGERVFNQYQVLNHDYRDTRNLVNLGQTESGIPVLVNRLVTEAELIIGIGNIVPHRYCGWAGGGKIIQPGICGEETTVATHLMITEDSSIRLGNLNNRVRAEIDRIALRAGLEFIINVVLDARQQVVGLVAGHPVEAHHRGVKLARKVYGVPLPGQAEVVITSSHPADLNFWQAGKALYAADLAVKEGGTILLVTPADEGLGEHREFNVLIGKEYDEIKRCLEEGKVKDRLSAAGALAVSLVKKRARVMIVTDGLTDEEVIAMGMRRYDPEELQFAYEEALHQASPGARVSVLVEGAELLPLL